MTTKLFVATKAFIVNDKNEFLILRESNSYEEGTNAGKYNIPGGRINVGENFREALLREVKEETGLEIIIGEPFYVGEWRPEVKGEEWQIIGIYFKCKLLSGEVKLSIDHDDYMWVDKNNYHEYNIIDNDAVNEFLK